MKYIKLKVQENNDKIKTVFTCVGYIEYIENECIIYSMESIDPIHIKMATHDYDKFENILTENDCISILNVIGYTQPYKDYEENNKKFLKLDKEIEAKADLFNKNKKILFKN